MNNLMETQTLLTVRELATLLRVHPGSVHRWVRMGALPVIRLPGGGLRFDAEEMRRRFELRTPDEHLRPARVAATADAESVANASVVVEGEQGSPRALSSR